MGFYVRNDPEDPKSQLVYAPTMRDQRDICMIVAYKVKKLALENGYEIDAIVSIANGGDSPAWYIGDFGGFGAEPRTIRISSYYAGKKGTAGKKGEPREMHTDLERGRDYKTVLFVDDMFDTADTWVWLLEHLKKEGYFRKDTKLLSAALWLKTCAEAAPDAFGEIIGPGWINLPRESPQSEKELMNRIAGYEPQEKVIDRQWKAYLAANELKRMKSNPRNVA